MNQWISELGKHTQSWGKGIHEWIYSLPLKSWLSEIGADTRSLLVKTVETGIAIHVWNATRVQRDKLTAFFKNFRKRPEPLHHYSLNAVQLPNPGRTVSIGVGFSNPEPAPVYSIGVYQLK
jgi:hypothetical protein